MKKKIVFITIGIILIAIIIAVWFILIKAKPIEKLIENEEWKFVEQTLKTQSAHEWKKLDNGKIQCNHCKKTYEIGDTINYTPNVNLEKIELSTELTGYDEIQIVNAEDTKWVVLNTTEDGKGLLITTDKPLNQEDAIIFRGAQAYNNGVDILNAICREFYSNSEYGFARSITIEDVNEYLGYTNPTAQYSYLETAETDDDNYVKDPKTNEKWTTVNNLTTKLKDIPIFEEVVKNGTMAPDGKNSKEALGEYCLNGYFLQTSGKVENGKCIIRVFETDEIFEVDAEKQDFIFGIHEDNLYNYWLASTGVTLSKDFVAFGLGVVEWGSASSCLEMYDSRGTNGLYYVDNACPGIRPVVALYSLND